MKMNMIESIKKIFGIGTVVNYAALIRQGAIIVDVRTPGEYSRGHIRGSVNISVNQLKDSLHLLPDKQKSIIACCATGMRSSLAVNTLKSNGFTHVYNGGSWTELEIKI